MTRLTTPRIIASTALAATLLCGGAAAAWAAPGQGPRPCERPYAAACQNLRALCSTPGFTDADGDGVCDYWQEGACNPGNPSDSRGQGYGQGQAGRGCGFGAGHHRGRC